MNSEYVFFRLDSIADLILFPADDIRELDWHTDLTMIRDFYRYWINNGEEEIQPPDENEPEIGNPIAFVNGGNILSFAIPFSFKEGEIEIGAVATLPAQRNKQLCRQVISETARRILASGKCVTLTTSSDNLAMQAAAKAIGMRKILKE